MRQHTTNRTGWRAEPAEIGGAEGVVGARGRREEPPQSRSPLENAPCVLLFCGRRTCEFGVWPLVDEEAWGERRVCARDTRLCSGGVGERGRGLGWWWERALMRQSRLRAAAPRPPPPPDCDGASPCRSRNTLAAKRARLWPRGRSERSRVVHVRLLRCVRRRPFSLIFLPAATAGRARARGRAGGSKRRERAAVRSSPPDPLVPQCLSPTSLSPHSPNCTVRACRVPRPPLSRAPSPTTTH
jgi:hypothetical protein